MNSELRPGDRRRDDRRTDHVRLADFTIPELRKALVTSGLLLAVVLLFAYMVADVIVGIVAGIVLGAYLIPFHNWICRHIPGRRLAAIISIILVTVPLVAVLVYSWIEVSDAAEYLEVNSAEIAGRITTVIQRIPFARDLAVEDDLSRWVAAAAARGGRLIGELQETVDILIISVAVFLFTVFYILTDHERILAYMRQKVPGRYRDLSGEISHNIKAVVYGALYATFVTQLIKSSVVLVMNLAWNVPLAVVLAIASFFIGFFPIIGSWTVYVPVAIYLIVFRGDVAGGIIMLVIGFFGITLFMSMYLRPKIAAEKSQVLNFYWMFIALVTGVYTFGLIGIVIGPVLIGILKAVFDTVTGDSGQSPAMGWDGGRAGGGGVG